MALNYILHHVHCLVSHCPPSGPLHHLKDLSMDQDSIAIGSARTLTLFMSIIAIEINMRLAMNFSAIFLYLDIPYLWSHFMRWTLLTLTNIMLGYSSFVQDSLGERIHVIHYLFASVGCCDTL